MSDLLTENLIWFALVPLGIVLVGAVVTVILSRRWGTPNPFEQKMRHLSKIDEQKALLRAYDLANEHPYALLFALLQQFFGNFLIACVVATVPITISGIWILLLSTETPNIELTVQDMAQIAKVLVGVTGLQLLTLGTVLAYLAYIALWHFAVMRRFLRFEEHEKPKVLKRIAELERAKD